MALNPIRKRHIVCFGNELHGDDGFGARVYAELRRLVWPKDIEVFNAGIVGLDALKFLEDCRQAILVDALTHFGDLGEIFILRPEDLSEARQRMHGHGLGLDYLLETANAILEPPPDMLIIGVEVAAIKPFTIGLSVTTEQAVPKTVQLIKGLMPS